MTSLDALWGAPFPHSQGLATEWVMRKQNRVTTVNTDQHGRGSITAILINTDHPGKGSIIAILINTDQQGKDSIIAILINN